jgi:acetolactate synthase regulatory subunit
MNPAIIRSTMRWMPINEPQSLTPKMCTSRLVFSYSAAVRQTDFLCRPALLFLKMFILRLTRRRGQLVLQVLNGATQLPRLHRQDHQRDHLQMAGVVDWPRSIRRLILQIRMTSGNLLVVPARFLLLLPHHVLRALGRISK